jgi:hypothetical protein
VGASLQTYNEDAYKAYNEKALEACHNCGRTFLPDRLLIHLKSCHTKKVVEEKLPSSVKSTRSVEGGAFGSPGQIKGKALAMKDGSVTEC